MKKSAQIRCNPPLIFAFAWLLFLMPALQGQVSKIEINPLMVTNETGDGDATLMADEQELSGDPLNNPANQPSTSWETSYGSTYPLGAYIDLGTEIDLKHIFIFDYNGIGDLIVEYGEPGNWTYLLTEPLDKYKRWKRHDVNVATQYVRFVKTHASPKFSEVVLYADNPVVIPPAINDLTIIECFPNAIDLSWTDVAPNEATGDFTEYDLRYNTKAITVDNFTQSNKFPFEEQVIPGSKKSVTVDGLSMNTLYYFALKIIGENGPTALSNIASGTTTHFTNEIETKLVLYPSMVINESGMGEAGKMLNEQEIAGDPLNGNGGRPVDEWKPSNALEDYPASAYIDLGTKRQISRVFFMDINSMGEVVVESGTPGNWHYLLSEPCDKYMKWKQHDVDVATRYLRITLTHREAKFSEIVLYHKAPQLVEEKLLLKPVMISNPSGYGEAWKLTDEQEIAGDPANSPGGNPQTYWQTGFQSSIPYPLYAVLDLGEIVEVTRVFLRDTYDMSDFTIWTGSQDNWELVATDNLSGFLSWNQHDINRETRYLRFGKSNARANVAEVVVYGIDHTPGQSDNTPPAMIDDIHAAAGQNPENEVVLTWTAPGDDGYTGQCSSYDIRFSTAPITADNFTSSAQWPIPPVPSEAGTTETLTLQGLNPGTPYYFSIIALDDNLNLSEPGPNAQHTTEFEIGGAPFKIPLTPDMVLNEYVQGDATVLVDEQQEAGYPDTGNGGTPVTTWEPGSAEWIYPCYAMIDLGGLCNITEIYIFDTDGEDAVDVFTGEPFNWNLALTDSLKNNGTWNPHQLNTESRFIRLKINSPDTKFSEIVVYASRLEEIEPTPEPTAHERPTMDQLIGMNAFIDDPPGRMAAGGFVREYHSWMWCEGNNDPSYPGYPENENRFNVMGWNFDYFYDNLSKTGITVCPAIQRNVPWLTDFDYSKLGNKPVSPGENPTDPFAYAEHADHLFQYGARYGNTTIDDGLLKLADGQERLTGTNRLNYYENWNEQDKWWKGGDAFFNPYEYAAMASADKDGHQGTMEATLGVQNADPGAKLVMAGLAKPDLNYVKAMKLWGDYHRDGDMPVDVINVHHYCNDGNTQSSGNVGISPEADDLKRLMEEFVEYRDRYLPGKEVWITEFGYDTHPQSVQRAPSIGNTSQEEIQAQWLVRSYLALAAAGVDKAAMYMLRDVDPNSSTKFNTSGLCASKSNNWEPKPSWYYVYTLKNRLKNMQYTTEIESGNSNVWIYKFDHTDSDLEAYAVWCPTSNEIFMENYELSLPASMAEARLVELVDGSIFGNESILELTDGKVSLDVSERPVIVLAAPDGFTFPEHHNIIKLELDTTMVVNESGEGDPTLLVDEQELSGDPYMGSQGEPTTMWSTGFGATYPVHAYLDLSEIEAVEAIYLRDMNGTGNMSVSVGGPGNWTVVATENCGRYKTWSYHVIQEETRYIRVTKHEPSANISEILIYVKQ